MLSQTQKIDVRFFLRQLESLALSPTHLEQLKWSECLSYLTTAEYLRKTINQWDQEIIEPSKTSVNKLKSRLDSLDPLLVDLRTRCEPAPPAGNKLLALRPTSPPQPTVLPSRAQSQIPESSSDVIQSPELEGLIPVTGDSSEVIADISNELPVVKQPQFPRRRRGSDGPPRTSHLLEHHRSVQESLTSDLSSMAKQLKLNSMHFGTLLEKDREALEAAEQSIEGNYDRILKQGGRLKVFDKKSSGTTWMMIGILGMVMALWLFMFMVIRVF